MYETIYTTIKRYEKLKIYPPYQILLILHAFQCPTSRFLTFFKLFLPMQCILPTPLSALLCSFIMDFFAEYRFRPMETYAWFLYFPHQNKAGHEMVKIELLFVKFISRLNLDPYLGRAVLEIKMLNSRELLP